MLKQHNPHSNTKQNSASMWLMQISIAILLLLFGLLIHQYILSHGIVSIFWPGSGLALAALLIGGKRYIWGVLLGSLLLNVLSNDSLWAASGITLANIAEAQFGAWLLTRNEKQSVAPLRTLPDYLRIVALGGVVASIVAASIGPLALLLTGFITSTDYFKFALHWWMGDALGVALITPLILVWWTEKSTQLTNRNKLEALLLAALTFIAGQIIFFGWFHQYIIAGPKAYLMFIFISLAAIRLGARGVTFIAMMVAIQALSGAIQKVGFFANDIAEAALSNYWMYSLTLSMVGMVVNTYANEVKRSMEIMKLKDHALNVAANAIFITDINGRIEWANQAFTRLTGFSFNEIYGNKPSEFVKSGKQDAAYYKQLWQTIMAKNVWRGELVNRRKDGSLYELDMTITPLVDERGMITHFIAVNQDITERKEAEAALKDSESRWKFAIEGSGDGLWDWNVADSTVFFSKRWKEMLGYTENEIGRGLDEWKKRVHPADIAGVLASVQDHLDGKTSAYVNEHRMRCKDGSYKWILDRGMVVSRNGDGRSLRMIGTHKDVTARRQAEAMLKESESNFRYIIEASPTPLSMNDLQGNIIFLNKAFIDMLGYTLRDIPTLNDWWPRAYPDSAYRQRVADEWQKNLDEAVRSGKPITPMEVSICCKTGLSRVFVVSASALDASIYGSHLVTLHDITERKQAEIMLHESESKYRLIAEQEMRQRLEQHQFMAMLTHELKTPLATINLAINTISRNKIDSIDHLSLGHVNSAVRDMDAIIDRCIQADKIDQAGGLNISISSFLLNPLVNDTVQRLDFNPRLKADISDSLSINSDEMLLQIILNNLLENALKYSPPDSLIYLTINNKSSEAGQLGILISVSNAIGKAGQPDAAQVFVKYYRGSAAQRQRGTGLGLWLVKSISDQLGGQVEYVSHHDKVEFQVWLPQL